MKEGIKINRLVECLKHCLDTYLSQNSDVYGFSYIEYIDLSGDSRYAKIYIHFEDDDERKLLKRIEADKREIYKFFDEYFSTKRVPELQFKAI
jgi:ribosome-binding factor A